MIGNDTSFPIIKITGTTVKSEKVLPQFQEDESSQNRCEERCCQGVAVA